MDGSKMTVLCHECSGPTVWVDAGPRVGQYHYCRACKIETGPFAKDAVVEVPMDVAEDPLQSEFDFLPYSFISTTFSNITLTNYDSYVRQYGRLK